MSLELERLIHDILCGGSHHLGGIHNKSTAVPTLVSAVVQWAMALKKDLGEVVAGIEPCIRQSIFMSLLPAEALEPDFPGSIDVAIDNHLTALGLNVSADGRLVLRDTCINIRRLYGLNKRDAREQTMSIAQVRGRPQLYQSILARQNSRCIWCGVPLDAPFVAQSLDHITPNHLGDDPLDGRNWAIVCSSCNSGKDDSFAWSARPEAHDFIGRKDIAATKVIALKQRWSVLMRDRCCEHCGSTTEETELWVYRRIRTGLPVPVNCGVACANCARTKLLEVLTPIWAAREQGRAIFVL